MVTVVQTQLKLSLKGNSQFPGCHTRKGTVAVTFSHHAQVKVTGSAGRPELVQKEISPAMGLPTGKITDKGNVLIVTPTVSTRVFLPLLSAQLRAGSKVKCMESPSGGSRRCI